ncbi:MAG: hypothetical protein GY853_06645 [PVC group bacterium]|nr:hypothetical protein [PVC group bacterium]
MKVYCKKCYYYNSGCEYTSERCEIKDNEYFSTKNRNQKGNIVYRINKENAIRELKKVCDKKYLIDNKYSYTDRPSLFLRSFHLNNKYDCKYYKYSFIRPDQMCFVLFIMGCTMLLIFALWNVK